MEDLGPNSSTTVAGVFYGSSNSTNAPNGWTLTQSGSTLTVGVSASAAPGSYTAEYCVTESVKNPGQDNEVDTFRLLVAGFTVVATPPTLPPAGNTAFSWQGSVGGVNTGNGNKTTTLPITGWTMRGGMSVSCAL